MIYAIVVTYNGSAYIANCLRSLLDSSIAICVVLVDNASSDNSVALARQYIDDDNIVLNKKNLGFGQGCNIGIRKALEGGAQYILLLHQDASVSKNAIERLTEKIEKSTEVGVVSPLHLNKDGTKLDLMFSRYIAAEHCPDLYQDMLIKRKPMLSPIYDVPFINAAAWLLPTTTIHAVGGFNPLFFHYGEDRDYINRLKFHNLKLGLDAESVIYHDRELKDNTYKNRVIRKRLELVNHTNLNNVFDGDFIEKQYKKLLITSFLTFQRNSFRNAYSAYSAFRSMRPKIEECRLISSKRGMSFLEDTMHSSVE